MARDGWLFVGPALAVVAVGGLLWILGPRVAGGRSDEGAVMYRGVRHVSANADSVALADIVPVVPR